MSGRRQSTGPGEDPAVVLVEELLEAAADRHPVGGGRGARHALTICACVTVDDAPTWVIFDTDDGVGWCRCPSGLPDAEVVQAPLEAHGHAAPAEVLAWLQGSAADPWEAGGNGWGDLELLSELQRKIAGS